MNTVAVRGASVRLRHPGTGVVALLLALLAAAWMAATRGAYPVSGADILTVLWSGQAAEPAQRVFLDVRLPRVVLAVLCGAGLAVSGALIQGLFRNPLADPGLIGVTAGASLGAGLAIVALGAWWPAAPAQLGDLSLIGAAFLGGLAATLGVHLLARTRDGTRLVVMLLAGIAINAGVGAALGYLSFVATDEQLRSLQFWLLGSLGGARWTVLGPVALIVGACVLASLRWREALDALALGEAQARTLGVPVEPLKRRIIVVAALSVGAITACTGAIGFIGLVAPHLVRLALGASHRWVLPGSALLGATLVLLADTAARTWVSPAELPLGVLTALIGAPVFLALLLKQRDRL